MMRCAAPDTGTGRSRVASRLKYNKERIGEGENTRSRRTRRVDASEYRSPAGANIYSQYSSNSKGGSQKRRHTRGVVGVGVQSASVIGTFEEQYWLHFVHFSFAPAGQGHSKRFVNAPFVGMKRMHAPILLKGNAGSGPVSALPNTWITSILVQLLTEAGMGPDSTLLLPKLDTMKILMSTNAPTSGEMVPVRLQ